MKKLILILFIASIYSCSSNSDLNQKEVDTFIAQQFEKIEFGGIIERKPWTKVKWTNLKINHIKPIEITNENTRTVTANFDFHLEYAINRRTLEDVDRNENIDFIFNKSTDGKWYLKDLKPHNSNDIGIERWIKWRKKKIGNESLFE